MDEDTFRGELPLVNGMRRGGGFEPLDLPPETRHLDVGYAHATLTDKTWKARSNGAERSRDAIAMAKIMMGFCDADLIAKPVITAPINTNSPQMSTPPWPRESSRWHALANRLSSPPLSWPVP